MDIIKIEVMLHASYVCGPYHNKSPAYKLAVEFLKRHGMIMDTSPRDRMSSDGWEIKATEKGRVYVEALKALKLPVPAEPKWEMPK